MNNLITEIKINFDLLQLKDYNIINGPNPTMELNEFPITVDGELFNYKGVPITSKTRLTELEFKKDVYKKILDLYKVDDTVGIVELLNVYPFNENTVKIGGLERHQEIFDNFSNALDKGLGLLLSEIYDFIYDDKNVTTMNRIIFVLTEENKLKLTSKLKNTLYDDGFFEYVFGSNVITIEYNRPNSINPVRYKKGIRQDIADMIPNYLEHLKKIAKTEEELVMETPENIETIDDLNTIITQFKEISINHYSVNFGSFKYMFNTVNILKYKDRTFSIVPKVVSSELICFDIVSSDNVNMEWSDLINIDNRFGKLKNVLEAAVIMLRKMSKFIVAAREYNNNLLMEKIIPNLTTGEPKLIILHNPSIAYEKIIYNSEHDDLIFPFKYITSINNEVTINIVVDGSGVIFTEYEIDNNNTKILLRKDNKSDSVKKIIESMQGFTQLKKYYKEVYK